MEQAYFSPGISRSIIPFLDNAQRKVNIAMAWFTSTELFEALLECCSRGIKTELILLHNAINFMYYAPDFNRFIKAGGTLRIAGPEVGFMHHKFCIVDDEVLITGSYNWTYYAETRNDENIVISDNSDLIHKFNSEFCRIKSELSPSTISPRLSWDEIERRDDIDFRELNYEIEQICKVQHQPVRRVYETKTEVIKTEVNLTPYARYSIGILALDNNDDECFCEFVKENVKLPANSIEETLFVDSQNETEFTCKFIFGNPNDSKQNWRIIESVDFIQLVKGIRKTNLAIKFKMRLDDNGSLRVDISCPDSKEGRIVSKLDSNLVKYE